MGIHTAPRPRHVPGARVLLLVLVTASVLAALSGARISWPTTDMSTAPNTTVTTTSPAVPRVAPGGSSARIEARRHLRGLRELVRTTPSLRASLAEEIATLEAIARGHVPSAPIRP